MQGQDFQSAVKSRAAYSERGLAKRAISGNQSGSKSQMGGGEKAIKRKPAIFRSVRPQLLKRKKTTQQSGGEEEKVKMSLIHEPSQELAHSSLDLFTVSPMKTSRINSKYTPYYPASTISPNGPFELTFLPQTRSTQVWPTQNCLYVKKLSKQNQRFGSR